MTVKPKKRSALPAALSLGALVLVAASSALGADPKPTAGAGDAAAVAASTNAAISPQNQADALHYVIATDREIYCREYLAQPRGDAAPPNVAAGANPGEAWPAPCVLVRRACESIQIQGAEFSYALRSLRPIDPRNGPQSELEQRGLALVTSHPEQNYYGQEMLGGRRYFTAVYPDLPATTGCVDCHNRRPASHPQHLKVGEVLGGLVVRVPLEF